MVSNERLDRSEMTQAPESFILRQKFTPQERKVIENANGLIFSPTGLSIDAQRTRRKVQGKPAFWGWDMSDAGERLTAIPSKQVEVAIFPDPKEFFVPGSFEKSIVDQEKLAAEDAKRLGIPNVTQIIPDEASTLTELAFQYQDETGNWLFGQEYAKAQGLNWVYGGTKNPTDASGSNVARVGNAFPAGGLSVFRSPLEGFRLVGAVRLVIPIETK